MALTYQFQTLCINDDSYNYALYLLNEFDTDARKNPNEIIESFILEMPMDQLFMLFNRYFLNVISDSQTIAWGDKDDCYTMNQLIQVLSLMNCWNELNKKHLKPGVK